MAKSISLLLGAGFSAPMGYPIGNRLNELLLNCTGDEFAFHTSGVLTVRKDGKKPDWGYRTSYDISFEFCKALMQYFRKSNGYFDYEEFYDFILDDARKNPEVPKIAGPFLGQFGSVEQLISSLKNIYNQLVSFYIHDKEGKKWYDDEAHMSKPIFPSYTGFLNVLESFGNDHDSVNIHTLNHDMFFERLNHTDWLSGRLCDGFEELGSPYFGQLDADGRSYDCRLSRYTGHYLQKYKLYKLHGSFDYGAYYRPEGNVFVPETYLKTRYGIGFGEFLKEVDDGKGNLRYDRCWVNYHADFLTGTTSKITRYEEPLLFKELFKLFCENLKEADSLIIIGYGCKDAEVNRMVIENFDYQKKNSYVVDPFAGEKVKDFARSINAKLIPSALDTLTIDHFK